MTQQVSSAAYVRSPLYLPLRTAFTCSYSFQRADNSSSSQLALSFAGISLPNATLNITSSSQGQIITGQWSMLS